jgi:hypothetical protein
MADKLKVRFVSDKDSIMFEIIHQDEGITNTGDYFTLNLINEWETENLFSVKSSSSTELRIRTIYLAGEKDYLKDKKFHKIKRYKLNLENDRELFRYLRNCIEALLELSKKHFREI